MTWFVGLMSGTSADGVDAALLYIDGTPSEGINWRLEAFESHPYSDGFRRDLLHALEHGTPAQLAELHRSLGERFAEAVRSLLHGAGRAASDVVAIGSHGHTFWHRPPEAAAAYGVSFQLGDAATLAARTGIDVISDFRAADLAAGGQGAPLVPWADQLLLAHEHEARVLVNIGGMANLTWLAPRSAPQPAVAFDTGPGNALLDLAAAWASNGRERCDLNGQLAAQGHVVHEVLAELRDDPFFRQPPPRSTGRERFGRARFDAFLAQWPELSPSPAPAPAEVLATLTWFTAETIAEAIARWVRPRPIDRLVVSGGGAHNVTLLAMLNDALAAQGIEAPLTAQASQLGVDPDAREAVAFAALAWAHLHGVPGNIPSCTGASGPRVLGSRTPAPVEAHPRGRP
jgi:anhydro-N-acetylmuramic acid kinase